MVPGLFSKGNSLFGLLDSVLLMVDLQAKILSALARHEEILFKNIALAEGAKVLNIPTLFTEQNPSKLGGTDSRLNPEPGRLFCKMTFSALGAPGLWETLQKGACRGVIVSGIETHICIQQTCIELLQHGFRVGVVADATGAGTPSDHQVALQRMASRGIEILTVESILMEWTRSADHPAFREISGILKRIRRFPADITGN